MALPKTDWLARPILLAALGAVFLVAPAHAQEGALLTTLENEIASAAQGWQATSISAATSLFWILAGIEIGIAAVRPAEFIILRFSHKLQEA